MSRRRYISTDISTDPRIAELAEHGALPVLLYTWAITHADDWGRMTGDARQFKLLVCPGFDVTTRDVDDALTQIATVGLWLRYSVEGRSYLAFPPAAWFRYQTYIGRDKRVRDSSAFPAPADTAYLVTLPDIAPEVSSESYQITAQTSQGDVLMAPGSADHRALPQNAAERRESPQNTDERRRTPLHARTPSPSPSPSLSPCIDSQQGSSSERENAQGSVLAADAALSLVAPAPTTLSLQPPQSPQSPQPATKRKPPATVTPISGARVERARDPVWDACVAAMGAVPSNDAERGKWAKGIKSLKQSLLAAAPGVMAITPEMADEIAVRCARYRARFGPSVPLNPMALAGNWTTLAVDIDQSQEVQRHGQAQRSPARYPNRYAGDGRSAGRSAGKPAVGTPAYYAQARAAQVNPAQANDRQPDRISERISERHSDRYPAGGAGEGRDALALGHW